MNSMALSPMAMASHNLILEHGRGSDTTIIESSCRELLVCNTNGLGSKDTRAEDVAGEILRGVLAAFAQMRSPMISAATRGVCEAGPLGDEGDADRLRNSEAACRTARDSSNASRSDFASALDGAANAACMTAEELRTRVGAVRPNREKYRGPMSTPETGPPQILN